MTCVFVGEGPPSAYVHKAVIPSGNLLIGVRAYADDFSLDSPNHGAAMLDALGEAVGARDLVAPVAANVKRVAEEVIRCQLGRWRDVDESPRFSVVIAIRTQRSVCVVNYGGHAVRVLGPRLRVSGVHDHLSFGSQVQVRIPLNWVTERTVAIDSVWELGAEEIPAGSSPVVVLNDVANRWIAPRTPADLEARLTELQDNGARVGWMCSLDPPASEET